MKAIITVIFKRASPDFVGREIIIGQVLLRTHQPWGRTKGNLLSIL